MTAERGELAKHARGRHICLVGQMHLRGLAACRRALVRRTVEESGEEFVLRAMYRQERRLSHSSCSLESGDTLTFSQLSWSRTETQGAHTKSTQVYHHRLGDEAKY